MFFEGARLRFSWGLSGIRGTSRIISIRHDGNLQGGVSQNPQLLGFASPKEPNTS